MDTPVGAVFNIAQYALLLSLLAHVTNMEAHEFIYSTGDTHIYLDQLDLVKEQLSRECLPLPKLIINPEVTDIYNITMNDIALENYIHHDVIKYPVSM